MVRGLKQDAMRRAAREGKREVVGSRSMKVTGKVGVRVEKTGHSLGVERCRNDITYDVISFLL